MSENKLAHYSRLAPVVAVLVGFRLCLTDRTVRSLACKPWLIGSICWIILATLSVYTHSSVLSFLVSPGQSWWSEIYWGFMWLFVGLLLFVVSTLLSVVCVSLAGGVYQSQIALHIIKNSGIELPLDLSIIQEASRSVAVESLKLSILLPLMIACFLMAMFPLLTPIALLISSWLMGFQFIDISLDLTRAPVISRLKMALSRWMTVACFGATLLILSPFIGIILPPIAAAAAAWLAVNSKLLTVPVMTRTDRQ